MISPTDPPATSTPSATAPPPTTAPICLRFSGGQHDGQVIKINSNKCTIGSAAHATLRLACEGVHPIHCLIMNGSAGTAIRSMSPETSLNGAEFQDAKLEAGDILGIGPLRLEFFAAASESEDIPALTTAEPEGSEDASEDEPSNDESVETQQNVTAQLQMQLNALQNSNQELQSQLEATSTKHEQDTESLRAAQAAEQNAILEELCFLREQVSQVESLTTDKEGLETQVNSLLQQLEESKSEQLERDTELRAAKEQLESFAASQTTNDRLAEEVETLRSRMEEAEEKCRGWERQYEQLQSEIASTQAQNAERDIELQRLKNDFVNEGANYQTPAYAQSEIEALAELMPAQVTEGYGAEASELQSELAVQEEHLNTSQAAEFETVPPEVSGVAPVAEYETESAVEYGASTLPTDPLGEAHGGTAPPVESEYGSVATGSDSEPASPEVPATPAFSVELEPAPAVCHEASTLPAESTPAPLEGSDAIPSLQEHEPAIAPRAHVLPGPGEQQLGAIPADDSNPGQPNQTITMDDFLATSDAASSSIPKSDPTDTVSQTMIFEEGQTFDSTPQDSALSMLDKLRAELGAPAGRVDEPAPAETAPAVEASSVQECEPAPPVGPTSEEEIEYSQPESAAPVDTAAILAKFGHSAEDLVLEEPAPTLETSQPEPAPVVVDEEDDSIQDYMAQLMQRVGSGEDQSGEPKEKTPTPPPEPRKPVVVSPSESVKPKPTPKVKPLDPSEFVPRAVAPEASSGLKALRAVANTSTRSAIDRHQRRSLDSKAVLSGLIGLVAFGVCFAMGYMALNAPNLMSLPTLLSLASGFIGVLATLKALAFSARSALGSRRQQNLKQLSAR